MVRSDVKRVATLVALMSGGLTLAACQDFNDALSGAKHPPDEFTVLTKAPLVIPPDYNLRPPQPGIASRDEPDPDEEARGALFPQDMAMQAATLANYSDDEKTLITKTNALNADTNIRKDLLTDVGLEDQGPAFDQKLLYQSGQGTPANAVATPASAAPAPTAMMRAPNTNVLINPDSQAPGAQTQGTAPAAAPTILSIPLPTSSNAPISNVLINPDSQAPAPHQ